LSTFQVVSHDGEVRVVGSGFTDAAEAQDWIKTNRRRFVGKNLKIELAGQPRFEAPPPVPPRMREFERPRPVVPVSEQVPLGARGEFERAKVTPLEESGLGEVTPLMELRRSLGQRGLDMRTRMLAHLNAMGEPFCTDRIGFRAFLREFFNATEAEADQVLTQMTINADVRTRKTTRPRDPRGPGAQERDEICLQRGREEAAALAFMPMRISLERREQHPQPRRSVELYY